MCVFNSYANLMIINMAVAVAVVSCYIHKIRFIKQGKSWGWYELHTASSCSGFKSKFISYLHGTREYRYLISILHM